MESVDYSTLTPIFVNFSILFTVAILYSFIINSIGTSKLVKSFTIGLIFGILGIIGLVSPFIEGGKGILNGYPMFLATAGVVGGITGGIVSFLIVLCYMSLNFFQDGPVELGIVITAFIIGTFYGYARKKWKKANTQYYILLQSFLLQLFAVIWVFMLPMSYEKTEIGKHMLIMIILYPITEFFLILILDNMSNIGFKMEELGILNERLTEAGKLAHLGHWEHDIKTGNLFWADEIYKIFEIVDRDFKPTYKSFLKMIHPDDLKLVKKIYNEAITNNNEYFITHRIITPFKSIKYLEERGEIIYDSTGKPERAMGIVMDVTERYLFQDKIKKTLFQTFYAISKAIEIKDPYTKDHQKRVANLSVQLAMKLGWNKDKIIRLYFAALVHDIGKICIRSELLNKEDELSEKEFEEIKKHSKYGYDIFNELDYLWNIKDIILQHHEKCDGSGYPYGLTCEKILDEAKIISICDTFEAIMNDRPYRKGLGLTVAIKELNKGLKSKFDPNFTPILIKMIQANEYDFETIPEEINRLLTKN